MCRRNGERKSLRRDKKTSTIVDSMTETVYVMITKNGGSVDLFVKPHAFEESVIRYKPVFASGQDVISTQLGNFKKTHDNENEVTYVGQIEM